jgi:RNA polymerase sigma factor for flagellar operon FliA
MSVRRGSIAGYHADPIGREQAILQHIPLVHHVIGRLAIGMPGVLDREDLVAHGVVGLIQAIDRYDPTQGVPFAAWATIRIRGAIIDAVRALDIVSPATRQRVRALQTATSRLTATLGRFPTDEEVQEALGLSASEHASLLEAAGCSVVSIEAATDDDAAPLADLLGATASEDPAERGALLAMVGEALRRLDQRERLVLSLYYLEDLTLQEIASVLGIHKSVVVRLHSRAIVKLRAFMGVGETDSTTALEDNREPCSTLPADDRLSGSEEHRIPVGAGALSASSRPDADASPSRRDSHPRGALLSGWCVELGSEAG